ncbi:hypothetical protein GGR53DRAFT_374890 [Hypoxylon sp. FL1150]|nr:hypothetical protein GGR53DRAFT_374890 [Hypoxylon sp. FL1150]
MPILRILIAAKRPLSLGELGEVISLTPSDTDLSLAKVVNDTRIVLRCCDSLVILDEEHLTLHLIHPSVKQFLLGRFNDGNRVPFTIEDAEQELGHRIVTYLNWQGFDGQLSTKNVVADGIPKKIISLSLADSSRIRSMAIGLLKSQPLNNNTDIGKILSAEVEQSRGLVVGQFQFYEYAKEYWLHHTKRIHESPERFLSLFRSLVRKPDLLERSIQNDHHSTNLLRKDIWAIYQLHPALLLAITGNDVRRAQDLNYCIRAAGKIRPHRLLDEALWYDILGIIAREYRGDTDEKTAFADFIQMHPGTWVRCNSVLETASRNVVMLHDYVTLVARMKDKDDRKYIPSADLDICNLCSNLLQAFPEDVKSLADLLSLVHDMTDESYNRLLGLLLKRPAHLRVCKHNLIELLKQNYRTPVIDAGAFIGFLEAFDLTDYALDGMLPYKAILRLCPDSSAAYDRVLRTLVHFPSQSKYFIAILSKGVPLPLIDPVIYISSCGYGKAPYARQAWH